MQEQTKKSDDWKLATLTLPDAWSLYQLLRPCISDLPVEEELNFILDRVDSSVMVRALDILYTSHPEELDIITLPMGFIQGINQSGFIDFLEFIRKLSHGSTK